MQTVTSSEGAEIVGENITRTVEAMVGRMCISLEPLEPAITMTHVIEQKNAYPTWACKVFGNFLWPKAFLAF
jgi:hypothetical protein